MELLYLWIYRDNCFYCNEFNFSPEYHICVDDLENPQKIYIEINGEKVLNIFKQEPILNITAVVGSNGSGKTSLLSYIARNSCIQKLSGEEGYELFQDEEYKDRKSIYVFKDVNEEIFVFHNLENELDTGDYEVFHANGDDNVLTLDELRKQTIVYLSNSLYVNERLEGYSHCYPVINYNIHPSSIKSISSRFYEKIIGDGYLRNASSNYKTYISGLLKYKNEKDFQSILDIYYYDYLIKNKCVREVDTITTFSILVENSIAIINHMKIELSDDGEPTVEERIREQIKTLLLEHYKITMKNNLYVLYYNLLFDIYQNNCITELYDFDGESIDDCLDIIITNSVNASKFKGYFEEIKEFISIAEKFHTYENNITNESDLAYRRDRVVSYAENKSAFIRLVSFISNSLEKCDSYVLRYLKIKDFNMSSGERALTNFFSWLIAIPTFDKIMDNKINDKDNYNDNYLLLIDEADLYSHPEWQRQFMKILIDRTSIIFKQKKIQIVLTTHSPLLLSDFPKSNTIYLYRKENGKSYTCNSNIRKETFGANIYTILKDAFFLENGAVGEYARFKLLDLSDRLNKGKNNDSDELLINMVGSDIIRNELRKKLIKTKHEIVSVIKEENTSKDKKELLRLQKQLAESLAVINGILNSGDIDD